jgi:glycosyltransferase
MNKGLHLASGELVGFLNSDDVYGSPGALARLASARAESGAEIVFGDIDHFDESGRRVRLWRAARFHPGKLSRGFFPAHPGLYATPELCRAVGGFEKRFKICGDFDMMLRLFQRAPHSWRYVPGVAARMAIGGVSTRGWASYNLSSSEMIDACRSRGLTPNELFIRCRILRKAIEMVRARITTA